eukprot:GHRQ01013687.1.p1 GENE.GHRQ01013687.1~~GHRQ01013687.1.p1  ORF type:complete len:179 (+),score=59.63 GHRQ01013687.1:579-1115(+)
MCSSSYSSSSRAGSSKQQHARAVSKDRLLKPLQATDNEESASDFDEPETAREAIDLGLVLCKQQKWDKALSIFEKGLTLPGTGMKRFRDKPRLISDGEKMASLYNIACCHAQLQDARSGLVALSGCMELGYTDYGQVRTDPDLEFLRKDPRFEGLMDRFQKKSGGFLGLDFSGIFGNK